MNRSLVVKLLLLATYILLSISVETYYRLAFWNDIGDNAVVYMLDVGQGDSFLFITPDDKLILIDTGEGIESLSELSSILPDNVRNIDTIILTHPDIDHIGGFDMISDRYKISCLVLTSRTLNVLVDYGIDLDMKQISHVYKSDLMIDQSLCFGDKIAVAFYNFTDGYKYVNDTNAGSIITSIIYDNKGYLFLGDAPSFVLDDVARRYHFRCDLITAGHHGSKTSVSSLLLSRCHPTVALISVGLNNSYGHPSKLALDTYSSMHIGVLRTDLQGTLQIVFRDELVSYKKPINRWALFLRHFLGVID